MFLISLQLLFSFLRYANLKFSKLTFHDIIKCTSNKKHFTERIGKYTHASNEKWLVYILQMKNLYQKIIQKMWSGNSFHSFTIFKEFPATGNLILHADFHIFW